MNNKWENKSLSFYLIIMSRHQKGHLKILLMTKYRWNCSNCHKSNNFGTQVVFDVYNDLRNVDTFMLTVAIWISK